MARRGARRRIPVATVFIVFITTCIICYVVYLLVSRNVQKTAVIEIGNMGNQYVAEAVIVRDETVTDAEGLTSVKYFANEGAMALKGEKIAEVYASGYSQTDINRLLNIRAEIKASVKTLIATESSDARLEAYDKQVMGYVREVGMLINGSETGNLLNLERQLTTALTQRQTYIKEQYYNKQTQLAELYDSETSQIKKIQSWTNVYLASSDCLVSFYTDGYETTLDLAMFDQISIAQVRSVLNGESPTLTTTQRGRTPVFREVNPSGWYLLMLTKDEGWNPEQGQTYKVHLEGFDDFIVDATVTSRVRTGNELLVRMYVEADVLPVLNTRTAGANVGELYVSGLKVPVTALLQQGGQLGVVLTDGGGIFVPVEIVERYNDYAIIQSLVMGALTEGQTIRVF